MHTILVIAFSLCLVYFCWTCVVYPAFISPLAKIPSAHISCPYSPLWILWKRHSLQETKALHKAHQELGPIIRLGPNEVSVNCVNDGIRTIYAGGFEKWPYYANQFDNFGYVSAFRLGDLCLLSNRSSVPCMFSMSWSKPHSIRKRIISNVYSKSYLQSSPEFKIISQAILFDRLLPTLEEAATQSKPLEVLHLNYSVAMDFITSYTCGLRNGTNFIQDSKSRQQWMRAFYCQRPYVFWDAELPSLTKLSSRLGFPVIPHWVRKASADIEASTLGFCRGAEKTLSASKEKSQGYKDLETPPVVYAQLASSLPNDAFLSPYPKHLQIATEVHDHIGAGQETTGVTLTYLFHELCLHPDVQAALHEELITHIEPPLVYPSTSSNSREIPSFKTLDALPLLHAVIMETLRLHSAIPGPEPRITPSDPKGGGISLGGSVPLPGGVRVSAQAYSLHRNPDVFPQPEEWRPERWLPVDGGSGDKKGKVEEEDEARRAEMARWFWAFGSGGRMCIGRHLSMQGEHLLHNPRLLLFHSRFPSFLPSFLPSFFPS